MFKVLDQMDFSVGSTASLPMVASQAPSNTLFPAATTCAHRITSIHAAASQGYNTVTPSGLALWAPSNATASWNYTTALLSAAASASYSAAPILAAISAGSLQHFGLSHHVTGF